MVGTPPAEKHPRGLNGKPTPGRGCHLNAGHLAQLDTSTRGALQPLRLPHPRTRLHPRACAVGELGEICPGTGASAATSTGEGPTADTGQPAQLDTSTPLQILPQ